MLGRIADKMKYYVGIDLGGTRIKGGVTDAAGKILAENSVDTESEKGAEKVAGNIARLALDLLRAAGGTAAEAAGIGIGSPGMIDGERGVVVYSNNLDWHSFALAEEVSRRTGIARVRLTNDANAAALGEARFGAGKAYRNSILVTLGTGVGGGIILDGKLYEGNRSAGAEIGHMILVAGGVRCTCGVKGCFEAYASATALIRETRKEMLKNDDSLMWEVVGGDIDRVDGRTAWAAMDRDRSAKKVVDQYISYLADGLTNLANIFRPEVIMLGGGVSREGERLLRPVQELLDKHIFGGSMGPQVPVVQCSLGNLAGTLGAAALVMDD